MNCLRMMEHLICREVIFLKNILKSLRSKGFYWQCEPCSKNANCIEKILKPAWIMFRLTRLLFCYHGGPKEGGWERTERQMREL